MIWCPDCLGYHDPSTDCTEDGMTEFEHRDATEEELEGTVGGGAAAGAAGKLALTKLMRPLPPGGLRRRGTPATTSTPAASTGGGCFGPTCAS